MKRVVLGYGRRLGVSCAAGPGARRVSHVTGPTRATPPGREKLLTQVRRAMRVRVSTPTACGPASPRAPIRSGSATSRIRQSATRGGPPGDNAHMESFFHSLKAELIHGARFATARALRLALSGYLRSRYYDYGRLHSALRYRAPADYEARVA
jgi:transposase InsO family protein